MKILAPYRALDLTGPLGYMAGRVLADLGADVVKAEPPGGDPARRYPPLIETADGPQSAYWLAYNANKRGITLDLKSHAGRRALLSLAAKADFLIESFPPGTLEQWGLGYTELRRVNSGIILVSITPFGPQGPYSNFAASDLEIMALSGAMSLAGEAGGEPVRVSIPQSPMFAGVEAAIGALTALTARSRIGTGQHVHVSAQAAMIAALAHAPAFWDLNRENPERTGIYISGRTVTGARLRSFWPCRDGWITFTLYGGEAGSRSNAQLIKWMHERDAAPTWMLRLDWSNTQVAKFTQEEIDRIEQPIAEFFMGLRKDDFYDGVTRREILGYPVATVEDIFRDAQLAARRFWTHLPLLPDQREASFPGSFAVIDGERLSVDYRPPRPGEHNAEILGESLGCAAENGAG